MAFSKSARIWTLLVIDTVFLVIELVVGLMANSLALISDSLHMLNDVLSLVVALYALKLAGQSTRSSKYSYGWQRAEILGALINGVFLLALCFSIGAEALQRLFEAPEVGQPQLVVIVGSLGLLSNIVGLFLFHDHGHSHGGHSHSHGPSAAEEGHSHSVSHKPAKPSAIQTKHSSGSQAEADERSPLLANGNASQSKPMNVNGGESPFTDEDEDAVNDLLGHPARTREAIVRQAYGAGFGTPRNADGFGHRRSLSVQSQHRRKNSGDPNAAKSPTSETPTTGHVHSHDHSEGDGHTHEHDHAHDGHSHGHEGEEHDHSHEDSHGGGGGHGHSHGNMNMQGVFLHVLGDALGNVGVIVSGLIIWLTKSPYRFYSDPIISLVITVIIFSSALPLVRSASFILLQGTPSHVPLEKVHSAILRIPNVVSVHDLHIWSLSESKLVASMHILVSSQDEFGRVSNEVRKLLHRFGVHSSTIQPELLDGSIKPGSTMSRQGSQERLYLPNGDYEISEDGGACTVQCVDDSCVDSACCPPAVAILAQKSNASLKPIDAHAGHSH